MKVIQDSGEKPIIIGSSTLAGDLQRGQTVEGYFRFGCGYARMSRDGRHAWVLDLYQRKAVLTGKALASDVPACPKVDSIVHVKGRVAGNANEQFLWIRDLSPVASVNLSICGLELATPTWVIDHSLIDDLSSIWGTLAPEYRELINAILADPLVLRGFLSAPGSLRHHDAEVGGCVAHTVRAAKMAVAISNISPELDRDLLVASALIHDIGKSLEYSRNGYGRWSMTRFGRKVGHKLGGALLVSAAQKHCHLIRPEQLEDVLHMLTCSFAPAWAGYRAPGTLEALALSAVDRLCSGNISYVI